MSASISLEPGIHSFRVHFYESTIDAMLTLDWLPPGGSRETIPSAILYRYESDFQSLKLANDSDGDGLTDSQELASGTSSTSSDSDGDGLSDFEEITFYGTDPRRADTDSDGIDDYTEAKIAFSNPLVKDFSGNPQSIQSFQGSAYSASSDGWLKDASTAFATLRNGWLEYSLSIPSSGSYALIIYGGQRLQYSSTTSFNLSLDIDGSPSGSRTLSAAYGDTSKSVIFFLPALSAGSHTARVQWDNILASSSLAIYSLSLLSLQGPDSDSNSIPDWLDNRLNSMSLVSVPSESRTSPICVEGSNSSFLESTSISGFYTPQGETPIPPSPFKGPRDSWFADVHLYPDEPTSLQFSFQNGAASASKSSSWTRTDIIQESDSQITIRLNDSLLLYAGDNSQGTVEISLDSSPLPFPQGRTDIPYKFVSSGSFNISATFTPTQGDPISGSITVNVVSASFSDPTLTCILNSQLVLSSQPLPQDAFFDFDTALDVYQLQTSPSLRDLRIFTSSTSQSVIIARLASQSGPVLSKTLITPVYARTSSSDDGYFKIIETYPDGSQLLEGKIILSDIPEGSTVKIAIFTTGVTLDDGTTFRYLSASDFDQNGTYIFRLRRSQNASTSICHGYYLYQDGLLIGQF